MKKVKEVAGAPKFGAPWSYKDKLVREMLGAFAQAFNLSVRGEDTLELVVGIGELSKGMVAVSLTLEKRKHI